MALVHIGLFSMWWLYFTEAGARGSVRGFAALIDIVTYHARVGLFAGNYAIAIRVALYMPGLWYGRDRFVCDGPGRYALPVFAVLIVLAPLTSLGLKSVAVLSMLGGIVRNTSHTSGDADVAAFGTLRSLSMCDDPQFAATGRAARAARQGIVLWMRSGDEDPRSAGFLPDADAEKADPTRLAGRVADRGSLAALGPGR